MLLSDQRTQLSILPFSRLSLMYHRNLVISVRQLTQRRLWMFAYGTEDVSQLLYLCPAYLCVRPLAGTLANI